MKHIVNKKIINLPKIVLVVVGVLFIATLGAYIIANSKAQAVFNPIEAGLNFQAGWSNGLHSDADNQKIIDNAVAAGMKRVRIDIGWSTIEEAGDVYGGASDPTATYPSSASSHWYVKKVDNAVNYAISKGLRVTGIWWTTPPWNTDGGAGKPYTTRPAGYPNYPEYAESAEWAAKYWSGRIDSWEIWNEADPEQAFWIKPNGAKHTLAESNYYAALLKVAYPAIKKGDPNAKVISSGPSSVNDAWINELYKNGIKGYFDILGLHPYEGLANNDPLNSDGSKPWHYLHVPAVRQIMENYGDNTKPIWFTEMGYSTHSNEDLTGDGTVNNWNLGVTEQQQGDYLVKAIDYAKNNWPYVEVFIIYNDKNRDSASGDAETVRHQMNFGVMTVDNSPKPALTILGNYLNQPVENSSDLNNDGKVNVFDLSILLSKWGTADSVADINKDSTVNVFDLSILLSKWAS